MKKSHPICAAVLGLFAYAATAQQGPKSIPNGTHFPNPAGTSSTYSTTGAIDLTGPFFQSMGTNGRSCGSWSTSRWSTDRVDQAVRRSRSASSVAQ